MNMPMTAWGIVLLIVFTGAHYALGMGVDAAMLWVGVAVIILVLNWVVGRSMKNSPKGLAEVWMSVSVFGLITTLIVAARVIPVDLSWLMSLWLLLIGAAMFASGHAGESHSGVYSGVVLVFASLFATGFGLWYFMAGALFLGLFGLINGILMKK